MAEYSVKVYPAAQNDLWDIMEAANALSAEATARYLDTIAEKLKLLSAAPESFPLARDTLLRIRGYRTLQVKNYVVFFIINGKTVELHRVLPARRQYARLL